MKIVSIRFERDGLPHMRYLCPRTLAILFQFALSAMVYLTHQRLAS